MRDLEPGDRVYHGGQRYPEARKGTATILKVVPQADGTVEYLVQRDQPLYTGGPNEPTWWASYHTYKAERAP